MVGKPTLPNWLAYIRPHIQPDLRRRLALFGLGGQRELLHAVDLTSDAMETIKEAVRRLLAHAWHLTKTGVLIVDIARNQCCGTKTATSPRAMLSS